MYTNISYQITKLRGNNIADKPADTGTLLKKRQAVKSKIWFLFKSCS